MTDREFVRHAVATLAYRTAKTLRGAPESFAEYAPGPTSKNPCQLVAHMGDLFEWGLTQVQGQGKWQSSKPTDWKCECERFFAALERFDQALATDAPIAGDLAMIFQGPIADAFTHTGQLAMLRRLSGAPMKAESYIRADIRIGKVGSDQTPADPRYEFD